MTADTLAVAVPAAAETAAAVPAKRGWLFAYALPGVAVSAVVAPVTAILPSLYTKYASVSLAAMGGLFMVQRIFDALSDPLIGFLSDRTESRWGPRKPWIFAGGLLMTLALYFLFMIPPTAGIWYLSVWSMTFYLGYTMYQVPHMAWGSELTPDYQQRAQLFGYRAIADSAGGFAYTLLPIGLFWFGVTASTEFSPQMFRWLAYALVVAFPVTIWVVLRYVPRGHIGASERSDFQGLWHRLFRNKPLLRFMSAYLVAGAGSGIFAALFFPYFDSYLHIGDNVPHLLLVATLFTIVSQPFWVKTVKWWGKHRSWAYGWIANSLATLPMLWLEPGPGAAIGALLLTALYAFTNGVSTVAPFALLADIVDYEILKTRVDRAGNYYAFLMFFGKATAAVGGLAFVFLGTVFGYQIADGAANSDFANLGMAVSFCVLPSLFQILAVPLIWNFPIDQHRHDVIRKRIDRRAARRPQVAGGNA